MNKYAISTILILLLITCYGLYTRGYVTHSQYQEAKNQEARFQEQKDAYHARLESLNEVCDASAPLSDKAYAKQEALKGDPEAQYVYASYLSEKFGENNYEGSNLIPTEAIALLFDAAGKGHVKSQAMLCYLSYRVLSKKDERTSSGINTSKWCFMAANNNHHGSQRLLSQMYFDGIGVRKNFKEYYYWKELGKVFHWQQNKPIQLNDKEIYEIDQRVSAWRENHPADQPPYFNASNEFYQAIRNNPYMPLNVDSLVCGGEARDCKIVDRCGDLVGITCQSRPKYMIYNISTKEVISECPGGEYFPCLNFIPKEWTCEYADNLPVKNELYEKFEKFRGGKGCGDHVYVHNFRNSLEGGTYYHRVTGETSGHCTGPYFGKPQTTCKKPKGWYCD